MKRLGAAAAVAALFASGLAIGAMATHLYYASRLRGPSGPPAFAAHLFSQRLQWELDLTPEQARQIDEILGRTRSRAGELRSELGPKVRQLVEDASEEIAALLTAEQRRRYEELRRRQRRHAEHFLLGPPGPPGPRDRHHRFQRRRDRPPPP